MMATRARLPAVLQRAFIEHPIAWGAFALIFFGYISRLPINSWNVEILIARNLLRGHGFVVGPMDPPALWRPPFAVLALLPIEALFEDPKIVYKIFATVCLTATMLALFYLMKRIAGVPAAHFSQLFAFTLPALNLLVSRQLTLLSHLIMLATVFAALLATITAWTNRSRAGDARVGLAWGLAFLSRPETIVLFAVTFVCSLFVYRRELQAPGRVWRNLFIQAACFLLIYVPTVATFRQVQQEHDLIGQSALVTYYAGEYFASNTPAVDHDGEGYAESVRRFGEPSVYQHSLVRFALAQPEAVLTRMKQNIGNTINLFSMPGVHLADWIVFVVFGAVLAMSSPPPIPGRYLLLYGMLLTAASTYFLLFHIDPRYPLAFLLMLFLSVQIAAVLLWQRIGRVWPDTPRRRAVLAICTTVLVGLFVVRLNAAAMAAKDVEIDLTPFRALADRFRAEIGPEGTPSVGYSPQPDSDALLWFSYFANTSIPWVINNAMMPREKIYSFTNRAADYMLLPASTNLRDLGNPPVLWVDTFPRIGAYVCVDLRAGGTGSD
jgi:hypothetical protein